MSSLFYNNFGFYKIPITKTLLCSVVLSSSALNVPVFNIYRQLFVSNINDIIFKYKFWRIFVSKLVFCDTKDLIFGSLLLYYFRVFERRFGSHKYASYLFACFTISSLLEVSMVCALNALNITNIEYLTTGPLNLIFALFVNYYFDIPGVSRSHLLGIPISGKSLPYFLGFQAMISSNSNTVCAISGLIAGLICRSNLFYICDFIKIPKFIASAVSKLFGGLICSSAPAEPPFQMGATLEIQRQQHMELVEQQMLFARFREINPTNNLNVGLNGRQNDLNVNPSPSVSTPQTSTNAEHVTTLVEMGFDRQSVVRALQRSNNDMNLATNLLLSET